MAERRQAARREPIEIELQDGRVFVAQPLTWLVANDLGNEILRQNAESLNNSVRLYVEDDIPQLEMNLLRKISDWSKVLDLAFPDDDPSEWQSMTAEEGAELVIASLEVNHLEHLKPLVDPNSPAPTNPGGNVISPEEMTTGLGAKTESTPSSSSEASPENPSLV